jgi:FkbM family methyltransferase
MLKASPELRLCADAHEEEVITKDCYKLKELAERDHDIKYIVDIGANIGAFTIKSSQVFPEAKIIACEPEPKLMEAIKENVADIPRHNVTFVEKAIVGDDEGDTVQFSVCKWQGNHHVKGRFRMDTYGVPEVGSEILYEITVPATTLMEVVEENNLPRIDLLKIDTEGAEPEILESIKSWLPNVRHIVCEWHSQEDLARIQEALKDTHNTTLIDGFFHEQNGAVANGEIFGEPK